MTRENEGNETMIATHSQLATLAISMKLTSKEAVALPSVVELAADKLQTTTAAVVRFCWEKAEIRDYLAGVCRTVAAECL